MGRIADGYGYFLSTSVVFNFLLYKIFQVLKENIRKNERFSKRWPKHMNTVKVEKHFLG